MPGQARTLRPREGSKTFGLPNVFTTDSNPRDVLWVRILKWAPKIFHTSKRELSMPTTHSSLHVHIIFSTKERAPLLTTDLIEDAHAYIGGILRELDCKPVAVGGVADHVHILVGMRPIHRLSDVMRETKKVSSIWMNARRRGFAWQEGYGAFGVSNHEVPMMMQYVSHQADHHKNKSFLEEMEQVYRLAGVPFDASEFS